jgi:hypothetical protein
VKGIEARLDLASSGIETLLTKGEKIMIAGVALTRDHVLAHLKKLSEPFEAVRSAKHDLQQKVQDRRRIQPEATVFLADVRIGLIGLLGRENPDLLKAGFKPHKKARPATVEEKALRAEKARLTRAKRGTLGSRQKRDVVADAPSSVTITRGGTEAAGGNGAATPPPATPPAVNGGSTPRVA